MRKMKRKSRRVQAVRVKKMLWSVTENKINPIDVEDKINHPAHYTSHPSGVECIDITRHMNFNCGNAVKYIWRHGEKTNPIEDLKKARWYIDDEIKRLGGV